MLNSKTLMTYLLALFVGFTMVACDDDDCSDTAGAAAGDEAEAEETEVDDSCVESGETAGMMAGEVVAGMLSGEEVGGNGAGEEVGGNGAGEEVGGNGAGEEVAGETPTSTYNFVIVQDKSEDINDDGTAGADICEVSITCDDTEVEDAVIGSDLGDSGICDGSNSDNCVCETEVPVVCTSGIDRSDALNAFNGDKNCGDDYVSIGMNGRLSFEVEGLGECSSIGVEVVEKEGPDNESFVVGLCESDDVDLSEMIMGDSCTVLGESNGGEAANFSWPSE